METQSIGQTIITASGREGFILELWESGDDDIGQMALVRFYGSEETESFEVGMLETTNQAADLMRIDLMLSADAEPAGLLANSIFKDSAPLTSFKLSFDQESPAAIKWFGGHSSLLEYYVGRDQSKIISTCGLYTEKDEWDGIVWLGWFCVDPAYRGQGLGDQMFEFGEKRAAQRHQANKLMLWTEPQDKAAHSLYIKHGMKRLKDIEPGKWVFGKDL